LALLREEERLERFPLPRTERLAPPELRDPRPEEEDLPRDDLRPCRDDAMMVLL